MKTLSNLRSTVGVSRRSVGLLRLASAVSDGETVTIGADVYEFDTSGSPGVYTSGHIRVDCSGGVTNSLAGTALVAAITQNNRYRLVAYRINTSTVEVVSPAGAPALLAALGSTMAGSNNAWATAAMVCGSTDVPMQGMGPAALQLVVRTVTATDVALGLTLRFWFPFTPTAAMVSILDSAGMTKAVTYGLSVGVASGYPDCVALSVTVGGAVGDVVTVLATA